MHPTLTLSPEQKTAHEAILAFVKDKKHQLRIGGYAGTGKTTLIANTLKALREMDATKRIAMACFTGKAAFVLREKLIAADVLADEYVGTIHGLMYEPVVKNGVVLRWKRRESIEADLLIIDEASMVSETIYKDLKKYKVPMLFIGDHGQLPPIGGQMALMDKPDITLTQIQRQAALNPIIALSAHIRAEGEMPHMEIVHGPDGTGWQKLKLRLPNLVHMVRQPDEVMFLCGYNKTRVFLNGCIRERLGFINAEPTVGEKLICLRNNHDIGIFNGMGGVLKKIDDSMPFSDATIAMEDGSTFTGSIFRPQFGASATIREWEGFEPPELKELFDWGYALTVHKAQGSEADRVVLIEERFSSMDDENWRRWLYTGVTRARKQLTVVARVR